MKVNRKEIVNELMVFNYNELANVQTAKDIIAILNLAVYEQSNSESPVLPESSIDRLQKLFNKVQIELMYAEEILKAGKDHPEFNR